MDKNNISKLAKVVTDEWKGYCLLAKDYNITQIPSGNGEDFDQLHIVIHQIKRWLRTTFSWIHDKHIDKYLAEYSFRINRSQYKESIFHKLTELVVIRSHIGYKQLIVDE